MGFAVGCADICVAGIIIGVFIAFMLVCCCDGIDRRLSKADMLGFACCCT